MYIRLFTKKVCETPREYVSSYTEVLAAEFHETLEEAAEAVAKKGGYVIKAFDIKLENKGKGN